MVSAKRKPLDKKRFLHMTGQLFADQYYHIYNARLNGARESLIERSKDLWPEAKNVPLEQLNSSLGSTDVFVIGTLFKLMPQQPSILRELEDNETVPVGPDVNFTSDEDTLVLHETDENVQVVGDIDHKKHVTGIPVSLLGHQLNGGAKFHVIGICYAGPDLSVYKMPKANSYDDSSLDCMLIISGFEFGFDCGLTKERSEEIIEALKKLRNFVAGQSTQMDLNGFSDLKVCKIIIAGNSVAPGYTRAKVELAGAEEAKDERSMSEVFQMFDSYLFTLAQSGGDIDVMPGKNDPTSFLLPQQPFHPKILTKSATLENVHPMTNPCLLEYKDYVILGTSGENVEAIRQHTNIESSTAILTNTLEWGHIAPSAPDNLSCVPFKETDPFIIDFIPDIYFAGNQPEFTSITYSTKTKPKVQIIAVPSFVKTLSCALIRLGNLEVEPMFFGTN